MTVKIYEKSGYWYARIQYYDEDGKQIQKWKATGFPVKGNNKRAAEDKAKQIMQELESQLSLKDHDIKFHEWMLKWLDLTKHSIKDSTYNTYKRQIENKIVPYFKACPIKLCELRTENLQAFYNYKIEHDHVKAATVHRYHANIHKALAYAVTTDRLTKNPADGVNLPKADKFVADYYSKTELETLLKGSVGSPIEIPVKLAAWFGLRRGECIGLRWNCIDFENKTLTVKGVYKDKGKGSQKNRDMYFDEMPKTEESIRTLAIPDYALEYLKKLKADQDRRRQSPGYNNSFSEFVCVRSNGDIIPLERVTRAFPTLCKKCNLRVILFHELRHSNVSLLLSNGVNMKDIQQIAGHSDIRTTMNTYGHTQPVNRNAADIMQRIFGGNK